MDKAANRGIEEIRRQRAFIPRSTNLVTISAAFTAPDRRPAASRPLGHNLVLPRGAPEPLNCREQPSPARLAFGVRTSIDKSSSNRARAFVVEADLLLNMTQGRSRRDDPQCSPSTTRAVTWPIWVEHHRGPHLGRDQQTAIGGDIQRGKVNIANNTSGRVKRSVRKGFQPFLPMGILRVARALIPALSNIEIGHLLARRNSASFSVKTIADLPDLAFFRSIARFGMQQLNVHRFASIASSHELYGCII